MIRAWKYRIYPSKNQQKDLERYLINCKNLWNSLLNYTKLYYKNTLKFPSRKKLYSLTKETCLFSQVAQNVADRLSKSLHLMTMKNKTGQNAGFPRFKQIERFKSLTYPQFGFKLKEKLVLSKIGNVSIKKHRELQGKIKTLTIKKCSSGKWYAIFTTEIEKIPKKKKGSIVGVDLGIEHFGYLSDGAIIENPRNLKQAEQKLKQRHRQLSSKKKGSKNRKKARLKVAVTYEKLTNKRTDFLHKISRKLADKYSFIALENLNIKGMTRAFLAKSVLDCSWAAFLNMLHYKAEEAGCEVVLVNPAQTTQKCSNCGLIQKKSLAERKHSCACGMSMHRDLNAAINILKRATLGHRESNAWGEDGNSFLSEPRNSSLV